jgi:hypothetical protein
MKTAVKSKHGGARAGSGRKPRLQYEARELFCMAVDDRWELILAKLDEFIEKGDKEVLKMLIEQRIGRPGQSVDMTAKILNEEVSAPGGEHLQEIASRVAAELKKEKCGY